MMRTYPFIPKVEGNNEYVILEAKIMLKNIDLSIQEIAYRLNFATQSAFGKYFKLKTGIGPKLYRNGDCDKDEE